MMIAPGSYWVFDYGANRCVAESPEGFKDMVRGIGLRCHGRRVPHHLSGCNPTATNMHP